MRRQRFLTHVALCGILGTVLTGTACRRDEPAEPATGLQSEATYPTNRQVTTVGCVMPGETADTFLLMAGQAEGSGETANYHLVAGPDMNLQEQVGRRVQVSGTVELRNTSYSQTFQTPAARDEDKERPRGTSGETPKVQTRTEVSMERLAVEKISPLGDKCEM